MDCDLTVTDLGGTLVNVSQFVADTPVGATARYLRVQGHVLQIITNSLKAWELFTDTFYPVGMFGVSETTADNFSGGLTIVDRTCGLNEVHEFLQSVTATATKSDYELTRNYRLPRFDTTNCSVFVLEDVNSYEPAALVRKDRNLTILRPDSSLGDRWLTRVIRDVATRYAKAGGSLVLHSSAFVFGEGAYLVIGDSGAGKSTTAIALARLLSPSGWMGNDRIHLNREGSHYRVTACPLPLAVNKGSLDVMGVTDFGTWSLHAEFPQPGSDWDQFMGEDKLKISSREVERYLKVRVIPEAVLAGVIFPQVNPQSPYAVELATPEHAADVIQRNCFSVDDNLYGEDWLGVAINHRPAPPSLEKFLESIADLPLLKCSVGSGADLSKLAADLERMVKK